MYGIFKRLRLDLEDLLSQRTGVRASRKSNPDWTYSSHKPECIVTTNPDRSVLIMIERWHFPDHLVTISNIHLKHEYDARSKSRFACYLHCYVTWCPWTTGIVASQCPSSRGAALVTRYLIHLISACLNPLKNYITIKYIYSRHDIGQVFLE